MSDSTPSRRPLWRRLLRCMAWSIGGLLTLCLLCYAILVAINWNDEALTPETQAWLTEPANPVPDAQNAWLAMLALAYPQQSGPQAGRRILDLLHTAPAISVDSGIYTRLDTRLQAEFGPAQAALDPSPIKEICSLQSKGPGVLDRIQQDTTGAAAQIRANQALLEKYYAAISLPQYAEEGFPFEGLPVQANLLMPKLQASCLARMDLSLRLAQNDPKAEQLLSGHLQYWLAALTRSHSLLGMMIANAQVQTDLDWINDLAHQYPRRTHSILGYVLPQYAAFANMSRDQLWRHPIQGELRLDLQTINASRQKTQSTSIFARIEDFALTPLFQPQATLNQQQACLAGLLRDGQASLSPSIATSMLYNPLGKSLDGCAYYSEKFSRVQLTQAAAGKFVTSLQSRP